MKVHAQKQSQPQQTASPNVASGVSTTTLCNYDFSRIPLRAPALASVQPERTTTTAGDCCAQDFGGVVTGGVAESPGSAVPANPSGDESVAANMADEEGAAELQSATDDGAPVLGWSTASGPTTSDCGGFDWRINWELDKRAKKGGAIVQKVDSSFEITDCAGHTNIYPNTYWEMWTVKRWRDRPKRVEGASYDDVFRFAPKPGNINKGTITMSGEAQFYPRQRPTGFARKTGSQADALPMRVTDPGLTGGTGAVSRSIKAEWNCCSDSADRTTYLTTEE